MFQIKYLSMNTLIEEFPWWLQASTDLLTAGYK